MPKVTFIEHHGKRTEAQLESGISLMQGAIDNGISAIIAECGGFCSCATCHCYVDDNWDSIIGEMSETEEELIEYIVNAKQTSRLSCQIQITDELDGLEVMLPASQY